MTATEITYQNFFFSGEIPCQKKATGEKKCVSVLEYVYQYKDHLGNVRLSYADTDNSGDVSQNEIIEESNYYAFGLKIRGVNVTVNPNGNHVARKFKYNGIEYEESLGLNLYEMELRQYDPTIARWTAIDPVTHWSMSTYTAFDNNPVFFADPSGADAIYNSQIGEYVINGQIVSFEEALAYAQNGGNADGSNNNTPCPPNSSDCNKGEDGKIENKYEMDVHVDDDQLKSMGAMALTVAGSDGPLPFADAAVITTAINMTIAIGLAYGTVAIINAVNEAVLEAADANWTYAKQEKEIQRILEKAGGPPGMTYMLTVNKPGTYLDVRGNPITLKAGEVWKYGETTKGFDRYSDETLQTMVPGGVTMKPIFFGNTVQIKVQEKIIIYGHFLSTGSLPPGNKIFR